MNTWFYIPFEKDSILPMCQLLDAHKGDLHITPDSNDSPPAGRGETENLVGKPVDYAEDDGSKGLTWSLTK